MKTQLKMGGPAVDEMFLENLEEFVYDENRIVCLFLININNPYKLYFFGYEVLLETSRVERCNNNILFHSDIITYFFYRVKVLRLWLKPTYLLSVSTGGA